MHTQFTLFKLLLLPLPSSALFIQCLLSIGTGFALAVDSLKPDETALLGKRKRAKDAFWGEILVKFMPDIPRKEMSCLPKNSVECNR